MKRQHPVIALKYAVKNIWLLIFPLLRGVFTLRFSIEQALIWLRGAWFDILVILIILGIGIWRWKYTFFSASDNCFFYRSGKFFVVRSAIPFSSICSVACSQNPFLRLVGGVSVNIDTNSGEIKGTDISLIMHAGDRGRLVELLPDDTGVGRLYAYKPSFGNLLFFSFAFSSTLSGAIYAATLFSQAGRLVDEVVAEKLAERINDVSSRIPLTISPYAFTVAAVIIISWLISFVMNLLRYIGFTLYKENGSISIISGIITKRSYHINPKKINYADLRQNVITRMFRVMSVNVNCTGYGKGKNEMSVFVPLTLKKRVFSALRLTLPRLPLTRNDIRSRRLSLGRYVSAPLLLSSAFAMIAYYPERISVKFSDLISFVAIMALIPCGALLFTMITQYLREGCGNGEETLTIRCSSGLSLHTVIVAKEHIAKTVVRRNIFQRLNKSCDIAFYTYSERRKFYLVRSVNEKKAREFLQNCGFMNTTDIGNFSKRQRKAKRQSAGSAVV